MESVHLPLTPIMDYYYGFAVIVLHAASSRLNETSLARVPRGVPLSPVHNLSL